MLLVCSACSAKPRLSIPEPLAKPPLPLPAPITVLELPPFVAIEGGLICISPEGYKSMALNLADVLRWVEASRFQLDYYRSAK